MPAYVTEFTLVGIHTCIQACTYVILSAILMSTPLLTVALPVYNAAEHLVSCIENILVACSAHAARILCCDDCSTDASPDILAYYAKKYSQITVLRNTNNRGIAYTRNTLLDHTDTKYHAFCDADDIVHPERFTYQLAFLEAHKNVDVLGTWIMKFRENVRTGQYADIKTQADDHAIKSMLLVCTAVNNPTIMLRTAAIRRTHVRHNEGMAVASDHDFSVQLAPFVRFANIPKVLHYYRTHAGQVSTLHTHNQLNLALQLAQHHLARFKVHVPLEIIRIFRDWRNMPPHTVTISQQKDIAKSILDISSIGDFYGYDGISLALKQHLSYVSTPFLPTATMRTHTLSCATKQERIKFYIRRCAEILYGIRVTHNIVWKMRTTKLLCVSYACIVRILRVYHNLIQQHTQ